MNKLNEKIILQKIKEREKDIRKYGVLKIGLFGSFVKGKQTENSDIDILVKFNKKKKTYRNFIGLSEYMEKILGRKVELITHESLNPYIAPYIESDVKYVQI